MRHDRWLTAAFVLFGLYVAMVHGKRWFSLYLAVGLYVWVIMLGRALYHKSRFGHMPDDRCDMHINRQGDSICLQKEEDEGDARV